LLNLKKNEGIHSDLIRMVIRGETIKIFKFVIIATHRRSGTHLAIDTIFNNFNDVAHGYLNLDLLLPSHKCHLNLSKFKRKLRGNKVRILKTHSDGEFAIFRNYPPIHDYIMKEILPYSRIIHIKRDGRDTLVSLSGFLKVTGIEYPTFSDFLKSKNNFDDIYNNLNRVEFLKTHLNSWRDFENKLSISFDELSEDYSDVIMRISAYLGLKHVDPIKKIEVRKYNIVERGVRHFFPYFFKTTAILPGEGKTGRWENAFSDEDLDFYNSVMNKKNRRFL